MILDPTSEMLLRLACFLGLFGILALAESLWPRRERLRSRRERWPGNVAVAVLNQLLTRLLLPLTTVALAIFAETRGWGLLAATALPEAVELLLAVLLLDLTIYLQHRLYHAVPVLWRLHRVHHADVDLDVSTGVRFHPLSVLLSALIKLTAVVLIGPSPFAVLLFEVLLNATSLFNHSNLRIPRALDRLLRCVVVTPDMHRVHHSVVAEESNHNFGFNFPWWDRLFRTYLAEPGARHEHMVLGLEAFRERREAALPQLLSQPFRDRAAPLP